MSAPRSRRRNRDRSEEAERCGQFYVSNARWLGGMLTNFKTMRTRIATSGNQLQKMQADGHVRPVAEEGRSSSSMLEMAKLEKYLGGVTETERGCRARCSWSTPRKEKNRRIAEARKLGIPIVAIVDTNCDPDEIDYADPRQRRRNPRGQADRSQSMADAVLEGKQGEQLEVEAKAEETEAASAQA